MVWTGDSPNVLEVLEIRVGDATCALPFDRVVEIVPRVHILPLPRGGTKVLGYFAYRGDPLPVVDLRERLGHESPTPHLDDHFVVVRTPRRRLALIVDRVSGLTTIPASALAGVPRSAAPAGGVAVLEGGVLLILDLEAVLSLDEERLLDDAWAALEAR